MSKSRRFLTLLPLALAVVLVGAVAAPYIPGTISNLLTPDQTPMGPESGPSSQLLALDINGLTKAGPDPTPVTPAAIPTRVRVPSLGIDLAVVQPKPKESFPLCDVAEFLTAFGRPGGDGTTVIYAHARKGMFGPLLVTSQSGGDFVGREVWVDTSDGLLYRYKIVKAYKHKLDFDMLGKSTDGSVLLQTSETGSATGTKLMLLANQVSVAPDKPGAADPNAKPRVCS